MRYLFILIISGVLFGQDAKTLYLFELEDESEYVGELIADTPDNVTIKRMDGSVVNIPAYKVIKRTHCRWRSFTGSRTLEKR